MDRFLQRASQSRSPTKAMSSCKNWEHFCLSRRPRYSCLGGKKMRDAAFPPLPVPFLRSRAWGALTSPFGGGSAPLPAWQGRCLQPHGDPGFTEVWDMDSREGWKASNTSTTWHVLVHLCGRVNPLPASTCPSQPQTRHGVTPKPRGEKNRQQTPVGLGLLHVTVADLCFVCCGSQA